ncbi:hypothetical protein Efla_002992 [Eimeria flavescens]
MQAHSPISCSDGPAACVKYDMSSFLVVRSPFNLRAKVEKKLAPSGGSAHLQTHLALLARYPAYYHHRWLSSFKWSYFANAEVVVQTPAHEEFRPSSLGVRLKGLATTQFLPSADTDTCTSCTGQRVAVLKEKTCIGLTDLWRVSPRDPHSAEESRGV